MKTYDACIVGSGAGGGAMAFALTRAGFRVVVLEKGPHYVERDFTHDELGICRRDFFVPGVLDEPHMLVRPGKATAERSSEGWIACCVGGGTVHMSGYFFRMHREDFALRTRYGDVAGASVADWPIGWDEMEPFYDEVERVIGVSGDAAKNPLEPRRQPYPLGPLLSHPSAALIDRACAALGVRSFPTPRAILSADYAGRSACQYCGFCGSYGCEVGAKSSSLSSFLALAQRTGKLTLTPRAMVTRIETDRQGRAEQVLYLDAKGALERVRARVIVLACSAIETARLLLQSRSPRHPHGLGNGSGLVGKNLMFATLASGFGRFPKSSPDFPPAARRLPFLDRSVQDHYLLPRAGLPHPKGGTILFMLPHWNPIFTAERLADAGPDAPPIFGAALQRRLREFFHESNTIEWEALSEFLPHDGCDVTLDPDVKDRFGLAVARIRIAVHPASLAASDHLAERGRAILEAGGARELGTLPSARDERAYTVLQAGTARMGARDRAVLDASGQSHEVKNLYVADGSGFPSSSGAPFTLTIMANALRVASRIVQRGARHDL